MRLPLAATLALALAAGPGCGLLGGTGDEAPEARHVVFLTAPGCRWVVAQSSGERFSVLAPADVTSQHGDVLLGDLRGGTQTLRLVPFPGHQVAGVIPVEVAGAHLSLADAQALWRARCPG